MYFVIEDSIKKSSLCAFHPKEAPGKKSNFFVPNFDEPSFLKVNPNKYLLS